MSNIEQHEQLIESGLALHEAFRYADALPVFREALEGAPECVAAQYNVANTLHMLGENAEASAILKNLLATDDDTFRQGCPLGQEPNGFKLDALYLLFLVTLDETQSWADAYPYALEHLNARDDDVDSVFSDEFVADEIRTRKSRYDQ